MATTSKYCPLTSHPQIGRVVPLASRPKFSIVVSGNGREHRISIADIAYFRIGENRIGIGLVSERHHPIGMRHIDWPQEQCLQHAEDDDIRGNAERQSKDSSKQQSRENGASGERRSEGPAAALSWSASRLGGQLESQV